MSLFNKKSKRVQGKVLDDYTTLKKYFASNTLVIPDNYTAIGQWSFNECNKFSKIIIGNNVKTIGHYAFSGCSALKEIVIPNSVKSVGKQCFMGCNNLEKVITPVNENVKISVLLGQDIDAFNYIYKVKGDDRFVISTNKPTAEENAENIIDLNDLAYVFDLHSPSRLQMMYDTIFENEKIDVVAKLVKKLKKNDIVVPSYYIDDLINSDQFEQFANADFNFFKNEFIKSIDFLKSMSDWDRKGFYMFANAFGCFSDKKIVDSFGNETDVLLSHKACSFLSHLINTNYLSIYDISNISLTCDFMSYPNPSQDFLKFISVKGPNNTYPNIDLILKLEGDYPNIFGNLMTNFNIAKKYRYGLDDTTGKPIKRPWEDTLKLFYHANKYLNINENNKEIADIFDQFGISQEVFNKASAVYEKARKNNVRSHILNKELKEESVLESIEKIKQQTNNILTDNIDLMTNLYDKYFTYEMLDKYDPRNAIIGIYCSCCATITTNTYGKDIAISSILAPDVQNLVVRNNHGEIVAKGTMYVNEQYGYAVINDFEINEKYKEDEIGSLGEYKDSTFDIHRNQRDSIFNALMRGIYAFVDEYDKEHPDNPIKKVNVGWGYNKLKRQCMKFNKDTLRLKVPTSYRFLDAEETIQYTLYDRDKVVHDYTKDLEKK